MTLARIERIVSGGQTGVDRAALDVAMARDVPHGGWCPRGRRAEDGRIPARYALREHDSPAYADRTEQNVLDSDGTLVLTMGAPQGGTALTVQLAGRHRRPCVVIDLERPTPPAAVVNWLTANDVRILNVAGPRESTRPGIHDEAAAFLERVLDTINGD